MRLAYRNWSVITYTCPYLDREVTEIWDGLTPYVFVNSYLRDKSQLSSWEPSSVKTKAYRLLAFVRWLEESERSFRDQDVRLGGRAILVFRTTLLQKIKSRNRSTVSSLTKVTAREIMGEVLGLCRYWKGSGERIRGDESKVGIEESRKSKRPAAFEIRIRNRSEKGKESLHPEEIDAV